MARIGQILSVAPGNYTRELVTCPPVHIRSGSEYPTVPGGESVIGFLVWVGGRITFYHSSPTEKLFETKGQLRHI